MLLAFLNWADFFSTLFGALVGGALAVVASLWAASVQHRFEVSAQFAARVGAVLGGIQSAVTLIEANDKRRQKAVQDARYYLGEATPFLAVVKLRDKKATADAVRTYEGLDAAIEVLEGVVRGKPESTLDEAKTATTSAVEAYEEYVARARRLWRWPWQ